MINMDFKRFRYHKSLPNFYKANNPLTPKREISHDLLLKLDNLAKNIISLELAILNCLMSLKKE